MNTVIQHFNNIFLPLLPDARFFAFKRFLWRMAKVEIGENVKICSSVIILGAGRLKIGSNTWIGPKVMICANDSITIGSDCDIAPRVYIGDGTHEITHGLDRIAGIDITNPISIGNGCWICASSTILAGVTICDQCVVAAGAVVTRSVLYNKVLVAGVPALVKKKI